MISIVIPIYNSANYLNRCLDSLQGQTYSDWEAVLVDDASTDDSLLIAQQYCQSDSRFTLIQQETNSGQSAARNKGMDHIQGDYLLFLDSDDSLEADCLEQLHCHIGRADLLQTGYKRVTIDGRIIEEKCPSWHRRYVLTSPCMRLYRTAWLKQQAIRFTEGMIYEDVLFSARIWRAKPVIEVYHYTGYLYLVNPHSTTSRSHDTSRIFRELRTLGIRPWQFNALLIRLRAHFIKESIKHTI